MKKNLLTFFTTYCLATFTAFSQNSKTFNDSLVGFDERAIIEAAHYRGITSQEMPFYLGVHKREFINQKYNIKTVGVEAKPVYSIGAILASASCVNEDFEEATLTYPIPSIITLTTSNAVNGWTLSGGSNSMYGSIGNCTNTSFQIGPPNQVELISSGASGFIDPIIGSSYPIWSVFGDTTINYPASMIANGFKCYGDWFIKLNNAAPGSSINELRKSFVVSPSNVIFNFAYIAVAQTGHCCCDNGAVSILFKDCLGNTLASSSQFSITAPASFTYCTPFGNCSMPSTITSVPSASVGYYHNKWANSSIDLTTWMGQCIVVQVTAVDCPYSGHSGYAYFDAQCAPTIVNNVNTITDRRGCKLYPNPNSGDFNITISKEISNGELEIRNVLGQVVHLQTIRQGNNQVKTENLPKGIYHYSVLDNKVNVSVGKITLD